jgi:hypothetical protein
MGHGTHNLLVYTIIKSTPCPYHLCSHQGYWGIVGARHPQSFGIYNYQIDVPYHLCSHQGYWGIVGARHPQSFGIYSHQIDVPYHLCSHQGYWGIVGARHPQSFGIYNYQIDVPYHLSSHQGYWGIGHGTHNLLVYTIIKSTFPTICVHTKGIGAWGTASTIFWYIQLSNRRSLPSVFTPRVLGYGARHPQSFGIYNYQIDAVPLPSNSSFPLSQSREETGADR